MYGKSLKELNSKIFVKKKINKFYQIENISTENEFSYKKITIKEPSNFDINENDFYLFIDSGDFRLNKKIYKAKDLIFCKKLVSIKVEKEVIFYIFFFNKVNIPKISKSIKLQKSKAYLKSYKSKKKYWGSILDLVNNKYGAIKIIHMNKKTQSSMEFHIHKKENYYLDYGILDIGIRYSRALNGLIKLKKNNSFFMKPGTMHMRMAKQDCKIIEMSTKDCDNDSIIVHNGKNYKFKVGKS
jgi:hypothetical protein